MSDVKYFRAMKRRINDEVRIERNYIRGYISREDMESRKKRVVQVFNHKYDVITTIK